jgi:hypothetical protein
VSTSSTQKRIEALEGRVSERARVRFIRIVFPGTPPAQQDADPFSADVGGISIQRANDEAAEAFLARVEAEARLAAKPGCKAVAVVWPRRETSIGHLK